MFSGEWGQKMGKLGTNKITKSSNTFKAKNKVK